MNRTDVQTLLGAASAIDPTIPAPSRQVLDMWTAMLDDVPADAGQRAVRDYYRSDAYRNDKRTITPADIVAHHRAARQDAHERQVAIEHRDRRAAIEQAPRELPSLRELVARFTAERAGTDPDEAEAEASVARRVMQVACPQCHAKPGVRCTTPQGRVLTRQPAHRPRMDAAHAHA